MSKRVHELKSAEDYQRWSLTHKAYMQSEGLWLYCLPAPLPSSSSPYLLPEPDAEKDLKGWQEWQLNVQKAVGKTQLTLSRNITLTAAHADHPVHLLAHLKTLFAGSSMSDVLTLHDRYSSLRCATGQAVQYLTDMAELRSQLAGLGDVVSDDKHALSVVQGLKDGPYDDLRRRLVHLLHLEPDRFSYAVVERMLLARSREEEAERVDQALAARMGAMRVTPHGQGRQQHQRSSGSQAQAGGASLAGSGRCFNCLQFGHFKVNCQNPSSTIIPAGHETKDAYRTRAAARQQAREGARASMAASRPVVQAPCLCLRRVPEEVAPSAHVVQLRPLLRLRIRTAEGGRPTAPVLEMRRARREAHRERRQQAAARALVATDAAVAAARLPMQF